MKPCKLTNEARRYARLELIGKMDRHEAVLKAIEGLPEPKEKLRPVAQNYKSILYGSNNANSKT